MKRMMTALGIAALSSAGQAAGDGRDALLKKCGVIEDGGKIDEAIACFQRLLKEYPQEPEKAMNTIAGLFGLKADFDSEIEWSRKAISANKSYAKAYINLGNGLAGKGKADEAMQAFVSAARADPKEAFAYYSQGVLHEQAGRLTDARKMYEKSVEIDGECVPCLFNLAMTQANEKKFDAAERNLQKLLRLDPKDEEARNHLERIRKMKGK